MKPRQPDSRATQWTRAARVAVLGYLTLPVLLTLGPTPLQELRTFTSLLQTAAGILTDGRAQVSLREAEALGNIVMFVPLGLLLALALPRAYLSVLLAAAGTASLAIELTQYLVLTDRVPALLDVATNTAGATAGLVLGGDGRRLVHPTRPAP